MSTSRRARAAAVVAIAGLAVALGGGCSAKGFGSDGGAEEAGCGDTQSDNQNCGACGNVCKTGEVCSQGKCATSCGGGTSLCGSSCVETSIDPSNCGACGTKCGAGQVCSSGKCGSTCASDQTMCGVDAGTPYCASTKTDNANCGGCGVACGVGEVCANGACANACASSDGGAQTLCAPEAGPPYCADTDDDNTNCGACGVTCGVGELCKQGACVNACAAPDGGTETLCTPDAGPAYCANTQTDPNNCGTCGKTCSSGKCAAGNCVALPDGGGGDGGVGTLVFDSLTGTVNQTTRGAGDSCGSHITIASQVTIAYIAQRNNLNAAGNMKFMIWQNGTAVVISSPVAVPSGDSWKMSGYIGQTLSAGTYDIGAISDTAGTWSYDSTTENVPPFSSTLSNPNWTNYATPTSAGNGGADCGVRLYE